MPFIAMLVLLLLIFLGLWIAFALLLTGVVGLWPIMGDTVFALTSTFAFQTTTAYTFAAVPLFIFMGELMNQSTLGARLYSALSRLLSGLPGGMLQANIGASAIFAASSGSSVASVATLGPMAYREQVHGLGLPSHKVLGSVVVGGTLGILIPPSIMLVVYGATTGTSVGALFAAALIPGILSTLLYMAYIMLSDIFERRKSARGTGGSVAATVRVTRRDRLRGLIYLWPFVVLSVIVIGSIYAGIATPTEAAALGVLVTFILGLSVGGMKLSTVMVAARRTVRTSSVLFLIVIAANVFSTLLVRYGVVRDAVSLVSGLQTWQFLLVVIIALLLMGMFFDGLSIMMVTLPFLMPMLTSFGLDPIWFGVIMVVLIEVGLITPPVGLNLFVMKGVTGRPLGEVVRGAAPYYGMDAIRITLLVSIPAISLWLPSMLFG